ncbi:MAG: hypothetical protein RLZ98_959 [Pseudomonadota bacterium]
MDDGSTIAAVESPWVWTAAELASRDDWVVRIDETGLDDIATALEGVKRRGLELEQIRAADFPLPSLAGKLAHVRAMLTDGLGLCLVRGLPVDRYDKADMSLIIWGLGTHVGEGVSQSYRGDMIGEVMDMTHTGDARRAYRSPRPLDLHIDLVDVVGLACYRQAKEGGASIVASSMAIHNAILRERPDLMPALYAGYHYRHSEASSTGEPPTSEHKIPVFGWAGDKLVCNFNSSPISRSFREDKHIAYDPKALEAYEVFIETAQREDMLYRMMLEPGDLQFLNNRVTLHGREEFEDHPELERKRLMLRVWLMMRDWATLPKTMRARNNDGGIPKIEGVV